MMNHIVDSIYPDSGQKDTTVVLFQEKNLRELKAGYPVSYTLQAEVFEAIASYGPRAVFIDFVFMDRGDTEHLLRLCVSSTPSWTGGSSWRPRWMMTSFPCRR